MGESEGYDDGAYGGHRIRAETSNGIRAHHGRSDLWSYLPAHDDYLDRDGHPHKTASVHAAPFPHFQCDCCDRARDVALSYHHGLGSDQATKRPDKRTWTIRVITVLEASAARLCP